MSELGLIFQHLPHARTRERMEGRAAPPPMTSDEREGFNGKLGLFITTVVGSGVSIDCMASRT